MPQANQNSCRICLGEGFKPIFSSSICQQSQNFPDGLQKGSQFERLAEKLRFVSMLPIADSSFLPRMLCYNCIVQLNAAYNFKTVIIETHMHLDRMAIESGAGNTLTQVNRSILDDDQSSVISSIRPVITSPPPTHTSSLSTCSTQNTVVAVTESSVSSPSAPEEFTMLDASQIKTEPLDELEENRDFIVRSAINEIMEAETRALGQRSRSSGRSPKTPRARAKDLDKVLRRPRSSPIKKPMVMVPNIIKTSQRSDKAFLNKILRNRATVAIVPMTEASSEATGQTKTPVGKGMKNLQYDLSHSKAVREILSNLPKNRLRSRRKSTY